MCVYVHNVFFSDELCFSANAVKTYLIFRGGGIYRPGLGPKKKLCYFRKKNVMIPISPTQLPKTLKTGRNDIGTWFLGMLDLDMSFTENN